MSSHAGPAVPAGGGSGGDTADSPRRAFNSAAVTLTLAILGSSVLPLPFAISRLGILPGLVLMLAVAAANALAGTLLLRAAGSLDKHSFEGLAETVGGRPWRLFTELCLMLLLFGNLCGDLCLLSDAGTIAARELFPGNPPEWLVGHDGRFIMVVLAVVVVFPLSCLRHMRELERVGMAGIGFVAVLASVFIYCAIDEGFPAIASGELPLLKPAVASNVPEAVGVLSFAFYLTPMLVPLLREMPPGSLGVDLTCRAVQVVTVGVAYVVYAVMGVFAAARYGLRTEGDVLENEWLPGRWDGVLSTAMTFYLSISMAPMVMALRCQLENLLLGEDAEPPRRQQVALTAGCVFVPLAVALPFPTQAEKMFAVTGATACCAVCYVMPIAIHVRLYLRSTHVYRRGGKASCASWQRRHRRSFSFDQRGQAGRGVTSGEGPDPRWLLSADFHAGAAAHRGQPPAAADLSALQQQAQQQRQPGEASGAADEEEGVEGGARGILGAHRFTDLSLSRWLAGQSFDSLGNHTGESLPGTPLSPSSGRPRDSFDSFGYPIAAAAAGFPPGWDGRLFAGAEAAQLAALHGDAQQQPSGADAAAALPVGALAAVPEAAAVVLEAQQPLLSAAALPPAPPEPLTLGSRSGLASCPGLYPCLADAGSGLAAVPAVLWHLVLPLLVLVLGVVCSVSALWLAIAALRGSQHDTA